MIVEVPDRRRKKKAVTDNDGGNRAQRVYNVCGLVVKVFFNYILNMIWVLNIRCLLALLWKSGFC